MCMTFVNRSRMQQNQLFHSGSDWGYPTVLEVWLHLKLLFPHLCWSVPENHSPSLFFFSAIQLMEFELERWRLILFRLVWVYSAMLKNPNNPKTKNQKHLTAFIRPRLAARQSLTVPDLHEALVTSLFQPREMEFDSGCSCPESSGGCIKKASQQCWQEYIYRDCVSFQEAAGGGAGCHRSPRLAGRPFDLHITCTG